MFIQHMWLYDLTKDFYICWPHYKKMDMPAIYTDTCSGCGVVIKDEVLQNISMAQIPAVLLLGKSPGGQAAIALDYIVSQQEFRGGMYVS